jgi:glutamyl-Q tRNA(Asp) synthetase
VRYRGRFAPTPSGPLHFGSIVAAVGSYLEARAHDGEWHVRIDDLDPPRVVPGAADAILRCLEALGFEWDGAVVRQSQRIPAYHAAFHRLRTAGLVYPCACSRKQIAASTRMGADGPIYPGACRSGMPEGQCARSWRIRTEGAVVRFDDLVLGPQTYDVERESGDFMLYRADGVYIFQLASAVDDAEHGMTHVVRGADLLESSARQTWLLGRLGKQPPAYTHLPVAVDTHGQKLSKQTHARPVDPARPTALWHALAFLGQRPPPALQGADASDLWSWAKAHWQLARVPRSRALPVESSGAQT